MHVQIDYYLKQSYKKFFYLATKFETVSSLRIPLERKSLHASAGRLSAPNGKFFKLHWITHVLAI